MKIDFTTDFDALLLAAKAKHKEYEKVVDECRPLYRVDLASGMLVGYPPDVRVKINKAREQWEQWVKVNIHGRGLDLWNDMLGVPCAVTAVLAGKKI